MNKDNERIEEIRNRIPNDRAHIIKEKHITMNRMVNDIEWLLSKYDTARKEGYDEGYKKGLEDGN